MKKNSYYKLGGITLLFVSLFSFNLAAQEVSVSQDKLIEIQSRVDSMTSSQLLERKNLLLQEKESIINSQTAASSGTSETLAEIIKELDFTINDL